MAPISHFNTSGLPVAIGAKQETCYKNPATHEEGGSAMSGNSETNGPSPMLAELVAGAEGLGLHGNPGRAAIWGTLTAILEQVPLAHRRELVTHFPDDVFALFEPRPVVAEADIHVETEIELEADAALRGGISLEEAVELVPEVIRVLRRFIPDEDGTVRAELPPRLRTLWSAL